MDNTLPERDQILSEIAGILELDEIPVSGDANLEELGWDSIATVDFLVLVEEKYARIIEPEDFFKVKTADDLVKLITN